jgi:hypothetical protein
MVWRFQYITNLVRNFCSWSEANWILPIWHNVYKYRWNDLLPRPAGNWFYNCWWQQPYFSHFVTQCLVHKLLIIISVKTLKNCSQCLEPASTWTFLLNSITNILLVSSSHHDYPKILSRKDVSTNLFPSNFSIYSHYVTVQICSFLPTTCTPLHR